MFLAYFYTVLKNIIYGLSVFFTGTLTDTVDVLDVLSIRFFISFAVLFILKITKAVKVEVGVKDIFKRTEKHKYMPALLLAGIFEPVLYLLFETLGVAGTTSVTAGVILSAAPIATCICEELILKEKATWLQKLFLGVGIVGVIYIAVNTDTNSGKDTVAGIIFILLAIVSGSMFMALSRKSSAHFNTYEITYISCLLGAAVFNFVNIIRHILNNDLLSYFDPLIDMGRLMEFLFISLIATVFATIISNYALSKIRISTSSAFGGLSTVTTITAGVLLGSEILYGYHYIGIALIIVRMIGVSVIAIRQDRRKKQTQVISLD